MGDLFYYKQSLFGVHSHAHNSDSGKRMAKCNCVKCSISYHEAYIKGITDVNLITCKKCQLKILDCECCVRRLGNNNSNHNNIKTKQRMSLTDKLYNIKNTMLGISESSLEVFELLLKLNGIVDDFKTELTASPTQSINVNDQTDASLSSDYEIIEDIYQSVDADTTETKIQNSETIKYFPNDKENSPIVLDEDINRRFSTKSDLTEFVSKYCDTSNSSASDKCYTLPNDEPHQQQSGQNQTKSCLKRNTTLSNTYRKPNFKFDGTMLNRVQNMSLDKASSKSFVDKKNENPKKNSSTHLVKNSLNQVSLDSGIYMPAEI